MLELLAPAGDLKSFEAAINCGADAVYLGLSDFNARKKAENFSAENFGDIVNKAHFYGVKVYVTVNTLVRDCEMPQLISLVKAAVEARADAFIVQDLGAAQRLKSAFPDIVLHASTQLGIHNLYGARIAEKLGFKRVVLSRETTVDDIRAIRDGTSLEIEFFVQGALCVAFSGNCYLSAVEQNASGNRGLCKQLCRLPYRAETAGKSAEGFLLSAKDLCLADSIRELASAGVTSFKIEGRLRREGYVASAVSVYRRLIDGADNAKLSDSDRETLKTAFCRGVGYLERAYLDGNASDVIEKDFNNHTGVEVGRVLDVEPFKTDLYRVTVSSRLPLSGGDGLKFFSASAKADRRSGQNLKSAESGGGRVDNAEGIKFRETASIGLGDVKSCGKEQYVFVTKTEIKKGWRVHLISSEERDCALLSRRRNVGVRLRVTAIAGEPLSVFATTDTASVTQLGDICERARTSPLSVDNIRAQMSKAGDSGFEIISCEVETDGVFVAKSILNAARRTALETLAERIITANGMADIKINTSELLFANSTLNVEYDKLNLLFVHNDDLGAFKSGGRFDSKTLDFTVLCPFEYTAEEIERAAIRTGVSKDKIALRLPVIANGLDLMLLDKALGSLPWLKVLVSENIYGFSYADKGYRVIAGAGHNVLNGFAEKVCKNLGAEAVLPSLESEERDGIGGDELPLMTFAHCPYKTVFGNGCGNCKYKEGMAIWRGTHKYSVRRAKLHNCYFGLFK